MNAFRLAAIQLAVVANKAQNIERAGALIRKAAKDGANMVVLPELFNCPLERHAFAKYAERIPGESTDFLSRSAAETGTYLVGGSIVEEDGGNLYNTSTVYSPEGNMIATHRKVHLFDVDIPGNITVNESDSFKPGDSLTTFDTPFCKVGLGICYEMRFPELALVYTKLGCKMIVYPGACTVNTGEVHWKALQRGRAIDNQLYIASICPARDEDAKYVTWGHSMIVSPWGEVLTEAGEGEEIISADIDLERVDEMRRQIPALQQKRTDIYQLNIKE